MRVIRGYVRFVLPSLLTPVASMLNNAPNMKTSRFLLRGFKRPREVASESLGKLEQDVLRDLAAWRSQCARYLSGFRRKNCLYDVDDDARPSLQEKAAYATKGRPRFRLLAGCVS